MEEFFSSFRDILQDAKSNLTDFDFLLYPLASILVIWLLSIIIPKIFFGDKKKYWLRKVFYLNFSIVLSSAIVAAIIICISITFWSQNIYIEDSPHLNLSHLLSLFISLTISIVFFIILGLKYRQDKIQEIISQPYTTNLRNDSTLKAKKAYKKIKLVAIIPLIGFLCLFGELDKEENLISFVVDNSGSMDQPSAFGDDSRPKSEIAQQALNQVFNELEDHNHIVLTTIEPGRGNNESSKETFESIVTTRDINDLRGRSVYFNNSSEALTGYNELILTNEVDGSPISEIIWRNYIYTNQIAQSSKYENIVLIIITDGGESLTYESFFNSIDEFSEFYAEENILFVDTEGNVEAEGKINSFFEEVINTGYEIEDGSSVDNYYFAINDILKKFNKNWFFVYWILAIFGIYAIVFLIVKPTKN